MTLYLIIKSLHIIAVISWMAGMLYLPRLFVYHVSASAESGEMLKVMERRLYKFIMNPAMMLTWIFGALLIWQTPGYMAQGWLHAKFSLVLIMTYIHHYYGRRLKDFANGTNTRTAKFYKILNEIPTVLMIGIVFLVVFKGF